MATIRDILKGFFSSGKKPTEAQFHELIDSYYHKTDDGLTMTSEGNLGVGIETPDVRLHVDGALKIGDAPEDATLVPPGTLRWNGLKLQVAFDKKWNDVWAEKTTTLVTLFPPPFPINKKANNTNQVTSGSLLFPAKTILVQDVSFTLDYDKSKSVMSGGGFGGIGIRILQKNVKELSIALVSLTGVELWSKVLPLDEGTKTGVKIGPFPVTGNKSVEGVQSFFVRFSIIGGGPGSMSVTVKDVTIKCTAKV